MYPHDTSPNGSWQNPNRNVAVVPVFPGSTTDVSVDVTVVDPPEDGRSTVQTFAFLGTPMSPPLKREVSAYSFHGSTGGMPGVSCRGHGVQSCQCFARPGWWYAAKYKMKVALCMHPSTVRY